MKGARGIEGVSDGVKAFTGILLQVYAGDPKVIIIDEPEAFLHPSLVRTLAKELATATSAETKHVFVATHSPDFIMGAIQSGALVNIVRVAYSNEIATARLLPNDDLVTLMGTSKYRASLAAANLTR
jgi:predicted ATPase